MKTWFAAQTEDVPMDTLEDLQAIEMDLRTAGYMAEVWIPDAPQETRSFMLVTGLDPARAMKVIEGGYPYSWRPTKAPSSKALAERFVDFFEKEYGDGSNDESLFKEGK